MSTTKTAPRAAALVAAVALLAGCHGYGSNNYGGNGGGSDVANQTYTGTVAGPLPDQSGTVVMRFGSAPMPGYSVAPMAGAGSIPLTATLRLENGQTVDLTGSYDPGSHTFTAQGGGFSLSGTVANGIVDGTFTAPAGAGSLVAVRGSRAQLGLYCGDYRDTGGADLGVWFIVVTGGTARGDFSASAPAGGAHGALKGSVSASRLDLSVLDANAATIGSATGTINGGDASGTWTIGAAGGTWQGSTGSCP